MAGDIATPSLSPLPAGVPVHAMKSDRSMQLLILAIALVVWALAASMRTVDSERVAFSFMPSFVLPQVCMSRTLLHVDCPGCGLTRSFIAMAHGDLAAAWHFHRVGVLLSLLTAAQVPYRVYRRYGGKHVPARYTAWAAWTLLVLFIGNWALHLLGV